MTGFCCALAGLALLAFLPGSMAVASSGQPGDLAGPVSTGPHVLVVYHSDTSETFAWRVSIACYEGGTGQVRWLKHFEGFYPEGLIACGDLVVADLSGRLHAIDAHDGTLRGVAGVEPGEYHHLSCAQGKVFALAGKRHRRSIVAAFDDTALHMVWHRRFPDPWIVSDVLPGPEGGVVEVLLRGPPRDYPTDRLPRYQTVILRADDGHVLRCEETGGRDRDAIIPDSLPPAARHWLTQLLSGKDGKLMVPLRHVPLVGPWDAQQLQGAPGHGEFVYRTQVLESDGLMFVGKHDGSVGSQAVPTIFAIRAATAEPVWEFAAPDARRFHIALHDGKVILAYASTAARPSYGAPRKKVLMALDAQTGRLVWKTALP